MSSFHHLNSIQLWLFHNLLVGKKKEDIFAMKDT